MGRSTEVEEEEEEEEEDAELFVGLEGGERLVEDLFGLLEGEDETVEDGPLERGTEEVFPPAGLEWRWETEDDDGGTETNDR